MAFDAYPALSIRQPDLGKTLITAAYLKSTKLKNQLMRGKMRRQKMVQGLGGQIMGGGGGGAPSGAGVPGAQPAGGAGGAQPIDAASPAMRKLVALDPEVGNQYLTAISKMNEEQRKQYKTKNAVAARLLLTVENAPKQQRPMVYAQALRMARQQGLPIENAPPRYDQRWVQSQLRVAMALDDELTAADRKARTEGVWVQTAKGKTWMRKDKLEGVVAENEPTGAQKNALAMGFEPGTQEYRAFIEKTATRPVVSISNLQESERSKAFGKEIGGHYGKLYTGLQEGARTARQQNASLERLDQLLDQTETGFGREFITKALKLGQTLGFETAGIETGVAPAEAAMALSNEMALQLRNPASGAGMPGQLSDKDREFLVSMVPGLGQTRAGRKLLINARKKMNRRAQEVAARARAYLRDHGTLDTGFEDELADWAEENPLFTADDFTMRERARLPSPQTEAERDALPPNTYYVDPNGETRRTPLR